MATLNIQLDQAPAELRAGLSALLAHDARLASGVPVSFRQDTALQGLRVTQDGSGWLVTYGRNIDAFRALGRLLGMETPGSFAETAHCSMLGIMLDCSRNGVMTPKAVKEFLRRGALMGLNMVMLYTEDTYEVPGEPFFGYLRGRYTHDELKALDDYADALGVEMVPCIQTLGHLEQILQWPAYEDLRDVPGVLMAEDARVYALLEKMISAASAPFRTKRIHIGMDEAHGVGTGRYKEKFGEKPPFDVLNIHLDRVRAICEAKSLRPMIWSDMYFRLGSKTNDYYDKETVIPQWAVDRIPRGVDLVYWDYYHADVAFYLDWIARHRALGSEPIFGGGAWTWGRFWTQLPYAFTMINASMTACRQEQVREAFLTLWGDDGMEVDIYSALPAMQLFAEYGYADTVGMDAVRANFRGSCDTDFDAYVEASKNDYFAFTSDGTENFSAHAKWLLLGDTLLGLFDPLIEGYDLHGYYGEIADALDAAKANGGLAARLDYPAKVARALSLKTHLRRDLRAAYLAGDKARLQALTDVDVTALRQAVDALWACHRDMWLATYKPFGLEVIEQRYGGLRTRLESLEVRLRGYLAGQYDSIAELDATPLNAWNQPVDEIWMNFRRGLTASCIK